MSSTRRAALAAVLVGTVATLVSVDGGSPARAAKPTTTTTSSTTTTAPPPAGWQAGAAKVDITPSNAEISGGGIWLGGYGSCAGGTRRATGGNDRIHARAAVLSDGTTKVAHVIVDTVGVSNRRIKAIQAKVNTATGIPAANVLVGATHTHSAPDMQGLWCGVTSSYKSFFDTQVAQAVINAHAALQPATLHASATTLTGMQNNRRGWGFTDTDLVTVQARSAGGTPIATLVEYAAHATCLGSSNTLITRDWPGGTQDRVEARGGGVALVNTGDQGDVSPVNCGGFAGATTYGTAVGNAAYDSLVSATSVSTPVVYRRVNRDITVTNGLFLTAFAFGWHDYDLKWCGTQRCINTDVAYLRLGPNAACQVQAGVVPGEALTRTGQDVKSSLRAPAKLVLGLTHNTLGYAVKSDEWEAAPNGSGYEESVSPTRTFGDTVISDIRSMATGDTC
jgi:hypothetical protein